jgi:hypothetical protein
MTSEGRTPMDEVISNLRIAVAQLESDRDRLRSELAEAENEFKRADRALKSLLGEPLSNAGRKPNGERERVRSVPSGIGEERMQELRDTILRFVNEHDAEEFRQVDIRSQPGISPAMMRSNVMANGFRILREEGFMRLSRQEGNNKWFRLTRETLASMNGDAS